MPKLIAIYLPQFHPIPENNEWWGTGFTEWTNVTKAKSLFKGHYQPQLPTDLGFYDLRLPEARKAQADLAKAYGIHGFCYYHYWFNGKRLLEKPIEEVLRLKEPDFPFMFCWANENWVRRWDGNEKNVLMKQEYSENDAISHARHLAPYFKDSRYIKVNGKPFFSIYRSQIIPDVEKYLDAFRRELQRDSIELYLARFEIRGTSGIQYMNGFDAAVEFQPFTNLLDQYVSTTQPKHLFDDFWNRAYKRFDKILKGEGSLYKEGTLIDYVKYVDYLIQNYQYQHDYKLFPGLCPSWDNTARFNNKAWIMFNSSPDKFKEWLMFHKKNYKPYSSEENFIFINAWNEWAEGNHLEPCRKWGKSYLEVVREVFS